MLCAIDVEAGLLKSELGMGDCTEESFAMFHLEACIWNPLVLEGAGMDTVMEGMDMATGVEASAGVLPLASSPEFPFSGGGNRRRDSLIVGNAFGLPNDTYEGFN
ncbi:hypothetical protein KHA91_10240 [Bacillus sp. FJAT-49682]|uniref:Uncharacterized protein n=1 Tax=Lederbergia citrea TaxID=2833581 RepID=A0A942UQD0_9BACI|nr:hypothetical protein [Lederbergia citrea]